MHWSSLKTRHDSRRRRLLLILVVQVFGNGLCQTVELGRVINWLLLFVRDIENIFRPFTKSGDTRIAQVDMALMQGLRNA